MFPLNCIVVCFFLFLIFGRWMSCVQSLFLSIPANFFLSFLVAFVVFFFLFFLLFFGHWMSCVWCGRFLWALLQIVFYFCVLFLCQRFSCYCFVFIVFCYCFCCYFSLLLFFFFFFLWALDELCLVQSLLLSAAANWEIYFSTEHLLLNKTLFHNKTIWDFLYFYNDSVCYDSFKSYVMNEHEFDYMCYAGIRL